MIQQTGYLNEESERKQVTMPYWTYNWLKEDDNETMSKSLKSYEALLFKYDDYEDSLTEIEKSVDSRLSFLASHNFATSILKIKNEYDVIDYENCERASHVNIHLPISLIDQLTIQRGIGDHIAAGVQEIAQSVYSDRMDRIQVKQQIADYIEQGNEPTHEIAQAVVDGEGAKFQVAYEQLMKHTNSEIENGKLLVRDDLTLEELEEVEHSSDGRGWTQKEDSQKRRKGLEIAVRNKIEKDEVDEYEYDKTKLRKLAMKIYGVGEATAQNYVDDIDIDWINTINFQPRRSIREIKKEYKENLLDKGKDKTKKNKIDRVSLNEFVLLDMKIPEGDEDVPVPVAEDWIEEMKSSKSDPLMKSKIGQIQQNARKDFLEICDNKINIITKYKK